MFGLGKTWKRFTLLGLIVAGATAGVLVGSGVVHGSAQQAMNGPWRTVSPAPFDPAADRWQRLPQPPRTPNFCRRSAVWTGTEMLVWGCRQLAFDPVANHWRLLPPAPTGVAGGLVVWTGRE